MRHVVAGTGLAAPDIGEAGTAAEAMAALDAGGYDVVVVEIQLPVAVGLDTIAALHSHSPGLRIVVCSFHRDEATKARAQAEGADAYLDKPVSSAVHPGPPARSSRRAPYGCGVSGAGARGRRWTAVTASPDRAVPCGA